MKEKLIKFLKGIATDSVLLSEFQADPHVALTKLGFSKVEIEEVLTLQTTTTTPSGPFSTQGPVTH